MTRRLGLVPLGAYCSHRRMRYVHCASCAPNACAVECPDCNLGWQLYEGVHGYYVVDRTKPVKYA